MDGLNKSWTGGWRAMILAALVAVAYALPGLIRLPVVDRAEASFAQSAAQMLESRDFTVVRFQDHVLKDAAPAGRWVQAASAAALSNSAARQIWAWRIPSLIAIAIAVAATAWSAGLLFGRRASLAAGLGLAISFAIITTGGLAAYEAMFTASCAIMLAGFASLYAGKGETLARSLFWIGLIAGLLIKGPSLGVIVLIAGGLLAIADRAAPWRARLNWGWGLLALATVAAPWIFAVTVATDGEVWKVMFAPGAEGGQVGAQTLALPFLLFPTIALLPAAAVYAWRNRGHPGVRLAVAWTIAAVVVFELAPGRRLFDSTPVYIALAWLVAASLLDKPEPISRRIGAGAVVIVGLGFAGACLWLGHRFGNGTGNAALLTAIAYAAAGGLAGWAVWRANTGRGLVVAALTGAAAHALALGVLLPSLDTLWPTRQVLAALTAANLNPRDGIALGPVTATGYAEPSLVFALGTETQIGDVEAAAKAIAAGRPAIVEQASQADFQAALKRQKLKAVAVETVDGFDHAARTPVRLTIYASDAP